MQDVRAHVKLQPICGTLSYSTILNSYKYCLGMTGTLECLTKVCATLAVNRDGSFGFVFFQERCTQATKSTRLLPQLVIINFLHTFTMTFVFQGQNELLSQYGFHQRTFLPSTFDKKALNSLDTIVVNGSYDEYFKTILEDITRELTNGRAILIVFADSAKLKKFSASIHKTSPNLPQVLI
jgi:hypothetical protein